MKKQCLMCDKEINISKDLKNAVLTDFEYNDNNVNNESKITHVNNIVIGPNSVNRNIYRNNNQPFIRIPYIRQYIRQNRLTHTDRLVEARLAHYCCCCRVLITFIVTIITGVGIWGIYIAT